MKKLIITCDSKVEQYANYLRQLISANDDKDGEIVGVKDGELEVVVWNEKQYVTNSPTLSSSQHILFVGNNDITKKESINIKYVYNTYGMKIGWLGKRAVAFIDKNLNEIEYEKFIEECKKNGYELEKYDIDMFKNVEGNDKISSFTGELMNEVGKGNFLGLFNKVTDLGKKGIDTLVNSNKVKDQQYKVLIYTLYIKYLNDFMES